MTCGIYKLEFNGTEQVYIGQSLNIERRYIDHCSLMRNNKASLRLNNAHLKYGIPRLKILTTCTIWELDALEDEYISEYDSVNTGFNVKHEHGHRSIRKGEDISKCSNEDIREIFFYLQNMPELSISDIANILNIPTHIVAPISCGRTHRWLIDEVGEEEYNRVIYNKYKRVGELNTSSIYTNEEIENMFLMHCDSPSILLKELAIICGINEETVKATLGGRNHKWLSRKYPDKYNAMLSRIGNRDSHSALARGIHYPNIISPDGVSYKVTNVKAFAKKYGLNDTHLGRTLRGLEKQHKGWKLESVGY